MYFLPSRRMRFRTLTVIGAALAMSACMSAFKATEAVVNAPAEVVNAVKVAVVGPGDTIGFPIRYESRPVGVSELTLRKDGTFTVRHVKDSAVTDSGRYRVTVDTLHVGVDCPMTLSALWLKGTCFPGGMMWIESPSNPRWPPAGRPKDTKKTAFEPADPRRSFGVVTCT